MTSFDGCFKNYKKCDGDGLIVGINFLIWVLTDTEETKTQEIHIV